MQQWSVSTIDFYRKLVPPKITDIKKFCQFSNAKYLSWKEVFTNTKWAWTLLFTFQRGLSRLKRPRRWSRRWSLHLTARTLRTRPCRSTGGTLRPWPWTEQLQRRWRTSPVSILMVYRVKAEHNSLIDIQHTEHNLEISIQHTYRLSQVTFLSIFAW